MEISESTNKTIRIALAQINVTVGDLSGNVKKISKYIENAKQYYADIIAFPELTITGYPPEDLLLRPQFIQDNLMSLQQVIKQSKGITCIVGLADRVEDHLYNGAAVISDGELIGGQPQVGAKGVNGPQEYNQPDWNPFIETSGVFSPFDTLPRQRSLLLLTRLQCQADCSYCTGSP